MSLTASRLTAADGGRVRFGFWMRAPNEDPAKTRGMLTMANFMKAASRIISKGIRLEIWSPGKASLYVLIKYPDLMRGCWCFDHASILLRYWVQVYASL